MQHIEQQSILAQEKANIALDSKIQEAVSNTPLPAITLDVNKSYGNFHIVADALELKPIAIVNYVN